MADVQTGLQVSKDFSNSLHIKRCPDVTLPIVIVLELQLRGGSDGGATITTTTNLIAQRSLEIVRERNRKSEKRLDQVSLAAVLYKVILD